MDLKPNISEKFLELFYKEIECDVPDTNSKLNLHILKIENNQFCYPELINELSNHFISFSLSRKDITEFKKNEKYGACIERQHLNFVTIM